MLRPEGTAGCPPELEIKSVSECQAALQELGLDVDPRWVPWSLFCFFEGPKGFQYLSWGVFGRVFSNLLYLYVLFLMVLRTFSVIAMNRFLVLLWALLVAEGPKSVEDHRIQE